MSPMVTRLSAVGLALAVTLATVASGQVPDHLQCFKIKDTSIVLKGNVDLAATPPFEALPGCKISAAKLYCVGAVKSNPVVFNIQTPITPLAYSGAPVSEGRLCYKISCKATVLPPDQTVTDQFGNHNLTKLKAGMLCTPTNVGTSYCGDGTLDAGEDCDGSSLGGNSCTTVGFGSGTLACGPGCRFDTSACVPTAFPATGQTECWSATGVSVSCTSTGQDGDKQAGANLAYVDNGDGTVTDINTGLVWEKLGDDGLVHDWDPRVLWANAFAHVNALNGANFTGHNDWRLPNVRELESLIDFGVNPPAVLTSVFNTNCFGGCSSITQCSCTAPAGYWSSTTTRTLPTAAYVVDFSDGHVTVADKDAPANTFAVRAVRGGPQ